MGGEDENFDLDFEYTEEDLDDMDKNFIDSMKQKSDETCTDKENDAYSFWFLIIFFLIIMFFMVASTMLVLKGRRIRRKYEDIGYK
jgi:hypothetical protein